MDEEHAKRLFCQLLSAVEYLHTLTILHWYVRTPGRMCDGKQARPAWGPGPVNIWLISQHIQCLCTLPSCTRTMPAGDCQRRAASQACMFPAEALTEGWPMVAQLLFASKSTI